MEIDERTRKNLKEIFEIIEKRKETFGKVLVGLAFSKNEKNELRVCFGLVKFLRKGETSFQETTYDYGNFILSKKCVEIPEALNFILSICENQVLKLDGWPEIPLKVHLGDMRFIQSRSRYGYVSSEWPMLYASARVDDSTRGKIPQDSLSKLELPLFPNGMEAINAFLELHVPEDWHTLESNIDLLFPDYRARIKNLRLAGNRVTVEVETNQIAQKDVLAKFYCKSENKSYTSGDLPLEDGRANYITDEEPFQVEAHILSVVDGKSIDRRKFDYRYPSREEGIIIEEIEARLLDIINKGENVNVEFKRELKDNVQKFLATVVAFANTYGGTIFLGVDDNCQIKGLKENVDAKILDLIADHCDPSIEVHIDSEVFVQDNQITLVKVPEGRNKPYILKNRGIFVRRGSSNRQIKRTELDDIYDKEQSFSAY